MSSIVFPGLQFNQSGYEYEFFFTVHVLMIMQRCPFAKYLFFAIGKPFLILYFESNCNFRQESCKWYKCSKVFSEPWWSSSDLKMFETLHHRLGRCLQHCQNCQCHVFGWCGMCCHCWGSTLYDNCTQGWFLQRKLRLLLAHISMVCMVRTCPQLGWDYKVIWVA